MTLGTKSVLYGAHCWFIHPWFVAAAWWRLYGFPFDPRLWLCFFVHDLGYIGKRRMDDAEGEMHPILGAKIVRFFCGDEWGEFCLLHSRFFSRRLCKQHSRLCLADKLSITLIPAWLYLPMVRLTGEYQEYMADTKYGDRPRSTPETWFAGVQADMRKWVEQHASGGPDTWLNGFDPKDVPMSKVPGYLDGGYNPSRYRVTKADGTISPNAKYLVVNYANDPHAILATLAYAISVHAENRELHDGIIEAVRNELGLSREQFQLEYADAITRLQDAIRP